ncbi:glycosyltransferase family 2 protein [Sphingobacterium sp. HMA12]|uniref:glycosyltransferase family 2 protein n=1 Tax=Sphingobacterium sp. HMA12 TaxID=2050894 RepID=UPI000CEA555D|nr:glycosyltransferase family 2 protein [Sphingobacterium sp. HMA12]
MTNQNEIVSIVTPLHNGEQYVAQTIDSVLSQTYQFWELIIVDDCSSDGGPDLVKEYMLRDSRIKLIESDTNSGPAISRNKAIEASNGKYIAFLDSDDLWTNDKLEVQINFMKANNAYFTFSYYDQIAEDGKFIKNVNNLPEKVDYLSSIKSNKIGCLTAVYDVAYFGKVYMEDIAKRQDYTLWLKLLKKVKNAYCVPKILAHYRIRENSVSSNKFKLVKFHWHIYRHIEGHSFIRSLYFISNYILVRIFNS